MQNLFSYCLLQINKYSSVSLDVFLRTLIPQDVLWEESSVGWIALGTTCILHLSPSGWQCSSETWPLWGALYDSNLFQFCKLTTCKTYSGNKIFPFFVYVILAFYLEIFIDSQEVLKKCTGGPMHPSPSLPKLIWWYHLA